MRIYKVLNLLCTRLLGSSRRGPGGQEMQSPRGVAAQRRYRGGMYLSGVKPRSRYLVGLAVGAFLLRWGLLSTRGAFLEFDESYYLLIARSLSEGHGFAMNGLPQIAFPPLPALLLFGFERLFGSMITPARVASAALGAVTTLAIYRAGRIWLNRRCGLIAASLTATCPTLVTFVPAEAPYARQLYFGHEPLGLFLMYASLWTLLGTLRRPTTLKGVMLGVSCALAYLTRNEWILFALSALVLVGTAALAAPPDARRRAWLAFLAACISLAAAGAPYPLYLRSVTGSWMITGKAGTAARIRPAITARVRDNDLYAFETAHYALAPSGDRMASSYWGYSGPERTTGLGLSRAVIADNVRTYAGTLLPALIPWFLWPFILIFLFGYFRAGARGGRLAQAAMLSLLFPSLVVCLFLFVEPRHHLYLVPLALIIASGGVLEASRFLKIERGWVLLGAGLSGVLLLISILPVLSLSTGDSHLAEAARTESLGRLLGGRLPPEEPIISLDPAVAFWAGRDWRVMPAAQLPQIVAYGLRRGSETIVFERSMMKPPPGESAAGTTPFSIFRVEGVTPEEATKSLYRIERVEENALFTQYRIAGSIQVGP